jgi:hypothetical protein
MKANVTQERIRKVLAGVLTPLARTLLRCGVSYTEFADLSKRAFVEAASQDYGVRNRPTNIARVAVMTGLSRKEVSRIRGEGMTVKKAEVPYRNIPAEVLHRWHTDPTFVAPTGSPKALPFSGRLISFTSLVRTVTGDIPPRTIQRELARAGAIKISRGQKVLPVTREFVPDAASEKLIEGLQFGLRRLAETICYNADPRNETSPHIQRIVHTGGIAASDLKLVRESLAAIVAGFGRQIDDYLTGFQKRPFRGRRESEPQYHVGVGLYYFENPE